MTNAVPRKTTTKNGHLVCHSKNCMLAFPQVCCQFSAWNRSDLLILPVLPQRMITWPAPQSQGLMISRLYQGNSEVRLAVSVSAEHGFGDDTWHRQNSPWVPMSPLLTLAPMSTQWKRKIPSQHHSRVISHLEDYPKDCEEPQSSTDNASTMSALRTVVLEAAYSVSSNPWLDINFSWSLLPATNFPC